MKRVLLVAFHFPPLAGSSGIQRALRFVQHLPRFGWQPYVLTVQPNAYERTSADLDLEVGSDVVVRRAFALDTARHLAPGGRYVAAWARPDRWISWKFDGVRQGLRMIREFGIDALWSTYPIATAHVIGSALQRRTGLPWIADFRDPMAQDEYPADPRTRQMFREIESDAVHRAQRSLFTTPGAVQTYARRYPSVADRFVLLENGYDEAAFVTAERALGPQPEPLNAGTVTLLHSGVVYPSERDPSQLVAALGVLRQSGAAPPGRLRVRFRAAVHDRLLNDLAARHGVADMLETLPPVPYEEALREMLRADALLVLQAANCNAQVPAKLYEYLRARRPVLCLGDPVGDTASTLRRAGVDAQAPLDDAEGIARLLQRFLADQDARRLRAYVAGDDAIAGASRAGRTQLLAAQLDGLAPST